jgi:hypothetical protein
MASSFSDLGIELMSTGENAGTWGDKTNTNLQIVEKAISGYVEQAVTSGGTTALSITDGDATESTSVARHAVIKLTGTITGNSIVTVPDSIEKVYIVTNGTSGAYTVQFKTASGTGITFGVSEKTTRLVYSDGTNIVDAGFGGSLDIEGRELVLDADGDTTLTADTDDQIDIKIAGADDFQFTANTFTAQSGSSIVVPDGGLTFGSTAITSTAAELNLLDGVSGLVQADLTKLAAVDSTAAELNIVDGGTSATSTTVADADRVVLNDNGTMVQVAVTDLAAYFDDEITAMPNLTSVGTLTTLTVDNVIVNGSTIGHTSDTDLITVASGIATVAGELSVTTLDIGGTNVTSTAAELNILDGVTSTAAELNILDGVTSTAAELNALDGITAVVGELNALDIGSTAIGTAVASKAVILDANKDYTGIRNLTISGDLTVSGDDITMGTNTAGNILVADGTNFNSVAVGGLSEISTVANDDVFLAVDTSGGGLKKIARSAVVSGLATSAAISNVVEDTSPQLGGNLDMNGQDIVTTSNADLELAPNGTGHVTVRGNTNQGTIQLNCENNSHGQQIKAAAHSESADNVLTLPSTGGDSTLVSDASTSTLTNKTLTTPVIAEIDSGSTITLDATTDIVLDADGGDIFFKDAGTTFGSATNNSGELLIKSGTTTAMTFSGANVTLEGNLTVSGTTTTVNSTTVNLNDHNIVLDSGNDTSAVINGAGITLEGGSGSDATFTYNTTGPKFEFKLGSSHEDLQVDQLIAASLDISGNVDVDGTLETDALSIASTTITSTAAELNIMDGGTSATGTTLVDADRVVTNDNGTMKQVALSDVKTYLSSAGFSTDDPTALAIALG